MIFFTLSLGILLLRIAKKSLLNLLQVFLHCLVHFGEQKRGKQVSDAQGDYLAFIVAFGLLCLILRLLLFLSLSFAFVIISLHSLHSSGFDREIEIADEVAQRQDRIKPVDSAAVTPQDLLQEHLRHLSKLRVALVEPLMSTADI